MHAVAVLDAVHYRYAILHLSVFIGILVHFTYVLMVASSKLLHKLVIIGRVAFVLGLILISLLPEFPV